MKSQNSIFRVRPVKKYTLDELVNCYLWFSKPAGFKGDANDANISAFITDTPAIERGFKYVCPKLLKTVDIHPPKTGISVHFSCSLS